MIAANQEVQDVLDRIRHWPPSDRRWLVEEILTSLGSLEETSASRKSLHVLSGLLRVEGAEPPDDDECRTILEEELMHKHLR